MRKRLINFEDIDDLTLSKMRLFRYYKMKDFISTIKSNSLYLKKPHCWDDPFENLFLKSEIINLDGKVVDISMMKERVFAQCWTLKEESDLMWNSYIPDQVGVKVSVSLKKLKEGLTDSKIFFVGKVKYFTELELKEYFSKTFKFTVDDIFEPFSDSLLIKRKEFSEENEVRIIFADLSRNNDSNKLHILNRNDSDYKSDFTTISINSDLIEEVIFHPRMSEDQFLCYRNYLKEIGYLGKMSQSKLYDIPQIKIRTEN